MNPHVILPRRTGRLVVCGAILDDGEPCDRMVILYRHRVRRPHWRHASARQANLGFLNTLGFARPRR